GLGVEDLFGAQAFFGVGELVGFEEGGDLLLRGLRRRRGGGGGRLGLGWLGLGGFGLGWLGLGGFGLVRLRLLRLGLLRRRGRMGRSSGMDAPPSGVALSASRKAAAWR